MNQRNRRLSLAILCLMYAGFAGYLLDRFSPAQDSRHSAPRLHSFEYSGALPLVVIPEQVVSRIQNRITQRLSVAPLHLKGSEITREWLLEERKIRQEFSEWTRERLRDLRRKSESPHRR